MQCSWHSTHLGLHKVPALSDLKVERSKKSSVIRCQDQVSKILEQGREQTLALKL